MTGTFYKMFLEDWDEGTDGLTVEQEGAYLRVCHHLYRRNGAFEAKLPLLARLWRCHPNKARKLLADLIDAGKVSVSPDGRLTNVRVTRELDDRETRRRNKQDHGWNTSTQNHHIIDKSLKNKDVGERNERSALTGAHAQIEKEGEEIREDSLPPPPPGATPMDAPPDRFVDGEPDADLDIDLPWLADADSCPVADAGVPAGIVDPKPAAKPRKAAGPKAERECRIPVDWAFGERELEAAVALGFAEPNARLLFDAFTDHWRAKAGKEALKVDWLAAWRTWLRNEVKFRGTGQPPSGFVPPAKDKWGRPLGGLGISGAV